MKKTLGIIAAAGLWLLTFSGTVDVGGGAGSGVAHTHLNTAGGGLLAAPKSPGGIPTFATVSTVSTAYPANSVKAGDIDRDGHLDLVVTTGSVGFAVVHGVGDGTFTTRTAFTAGMTSGFVYGFPTNTKVRDLNGDGKPDVAIVASCASGGSSKVAVALNTTTTPGTPTFASATLYTFVANGGYNGACPWNVDFGDFNGDGVQDMAIATRGPSSGPPGLNYKWISVRLGNPAAPGTFLGENYYEIGCFYRQGETCDEAQHQAIDIHVAELNGDGKLDLVIAEGDDNATMLGNGDGTFQLGNVNRVPGSGPGNSPTESCVSTQSLATGDLNGDQRPEIITGCNGSPDAIIVTNQGDGTFGNLGDAGQHWVPTMQYASTYRFPAGVEYDVRDVELADITHDGRLDLIVTGAEPAISGKVGEGLMSVFIGSGSGRFLDRYDFTTGVSNPYLYDLDVADFNEDGLPDVVAEGANTGNVYLWLNTTRPKDQILVASKGPWSGDTENTGNEWVPSPILSCNNTTGKQVWKTAAERNAACTAVKAPYPCCIGSGTGYCSSAMICVTDQNNGSGAVATDSIWTAKGQLAAGTGTSTAAVLAPGTDGDCVKYLASTSTGLTTGSCGSGGSGGWTNTGGGIFPTVSTDTIASDDFASFWEIDPDGHIGATSFTVSGIAEGKLRIGQSAVGTAPPGTCTQGDMFLDTNGNTGGTCGTTALTGPRLCICTATDTWKGVDLL